MERLAVALTECHAISSHSDADRSMLCCTTQVKDILFLTLCQCQMLQGCTNIIINLRRVQEEEEIT